MKFFRTKPNKDGPEESNQENTVELKEILVKEIPSRQITFTEKLSAEIGAETFDHLGYRTLSKIRTVCFGWNEIIKKNKNFIKQDNNDFIKQIKVVLTRFNNLEERNDNKSKATVEECKEIINKFKRNFDEVFMGDDEDKYRLINYIQQETEKLDPTYNFEINTFFQALMKVLKNTFNISDETIIHSSPLKNTLKKHDGPLINPVLKKREDIGLLIALTKKYSIHQQEINLKYEQTTPSKFF